VLGVEFNSVGILSFVHFRADLDYQVIVDEMVAVRFIFVLEYLVCILQLSSWRNLSSCRREHHLKRRVTTHVTVDIDVYIWIELIRVYLKLRWETFKLNLRREETQSEIIRILFYS